MPSAGTFRGHVGRRRFNERVKKQRYFEEPLGGIAWLVELEQSFVVRMIDHRGGISSPIQIVHPFQSNQIKSIPFRSNPINCFRLAPTQLNRIHLNLIQRFDSLVLGFYSRKYVHDFYARKEYIRQVLQRSDQLRQQFGKLF